jgi:tetratricopeptide (TPR) repeat protein/TolB-like protein
LQSGYNRRVLRDILLITIFLMTSVCPLRADSSTVLVYPFENLSGDRNLDWIGEGFAELVIERLHSEPGLHVFSREERLAVFESAGIPEGAVISRASALKLGWNSGADAIITGVFSGSPEDFQVEARIVDLSLIRSFDPIKAAGRLEDILPMGNSLSWQLLRGLVPASNAPESDYTSRPPVSRSAFENYIRGIISADPERRIELLRTAIRLNPQYWRAVFQLGRILHLDLESEESNMWLQKLGSASPNPVQSQFMASLNDFRLGNYAEAVETLRRLAPTYDVFVNLGAALQNAGDFSGAAAAWKSALTMNPGGSEALFNLAYASLAGGDPEAAAGSLAALLAMQPRDAEALFLLAEAQARMGRSDASQRTMAEAASLSPRIERWRNQPLPKLERLRNVPAVREVEWTEPRMARRDRQ